MKRNISLDQITDGRFYQSNDMVKVGCDNCTGCSSCCRNMEALVLDPYDMDQLKRGLSTSLDHLLADRIIKINPVDGLLLPILSTDGESGQCAFLDAEGRCRIHSFRPGICRLFPLGRYYHDGSFSYILQTEECKRASSKVKVQKWLGIPNLIMYEKYVLRWHDLTGEIRGQMSELDEGSIRILHMYLLRTFFQRDYDEGFYEDFFGRVERARIDLGLAE